MKKTFFCAVVFFILGALFLTACGGRSQKISPQRQPGNKTDNTITVEDNGGKHKPEDGARDNNAGNGNGGAGTDIAEPGDLPENAGAPGNTGAAPEVEITEGGVRNRDSRWTAVYGKGEILDALGSLGVSVARVGDIEVAQTGANECASTISVGGRYVSAFEFKEALGLKSTMITGIVRGDGEYTFIGCGEN